MKSDALKNLALRAKNRLLNKNLRNSYSTAEIKIIDRYDNEFYNKVKEITSQCEPVSNPLKHLMDDSLLLSLDSKERERYLFQTIEKYKEAKLRLERESKIC